MADKTQILAGMTTRQKVMLGVVIIIVLIVIWQVIGLFGEGGQPATTPAAENNAMSAANSVPAGGNMQPQHMTPQPAQLTKTTASTEREAELIKMQEETQAKYLAALNELQMLKVSRDIAEANQAIMTAKLATVDSEKKIVTMLAPPAPVATPEAYARNLVNPASAGGQQPPPQTQPQVTDSTPSYTVISVSELQRQWSAVLGHKGSLYNVHVGDILPTDGSKVVNINKSGVILEKEGVRSKVSLVPII